MNPTAPTVYPHRRPPAESVASVESATDRLMAMLNDPTATFTRDQVAYLMGTAQRWGYEAREAEENAEWLADREIATFDAQGTIRWIDQVDYRRRCDEAARLPRPNDFKGGLPIPPTYQTRDTPTAKGLPTCPRPTVTPASRGYARSEGRSA